MFRYPWLLVACELVVGLACAFDSASANDTKPKKPAAGTKPPVVLSPKYSARIAPTKSSSEAPKPAQSVAPKKVAPAGNVKKPVPGQTMPVVPKLVLPGASKTIPPRVAAPFATPKTSPKPTVKLSPQQDAGKILRLIKPTPQMQPPGRLQPGVQTLPSAEGRDKVQPLAVSKNGILVLVPPKVEPSSMVDRARGMIESDKQKAAEREKVLQGLFGTSKQQKTPVAQVMALETDQRSSTPSATIMPLGTDQHSTTPSVMIMPLGTGQQQGASATLMQFQERDNMTRALHRLKASPDLRVELGLQHVNLDKISGVHQERLAKLDNFEHWYRSSTGQKLGLKRQFEFQAEGDLSRRLDLGQKLLKAGGWTKHRRHGAIASTFTASAFGAWYAGGGCYPAHSWCPVWSPWVEWCWWDTCPVFHDPRPFGCIPTVYDPCPPWVYYDYPVHSLPVVSCGTWIDVAPIVATAGQDVQLLAVRFVDNGHPNQDLGPRYRVWMRNNGPHPIATPFSVLLLASNEEEPSADVPHAGVTVPSMDIGETQACDIRLPLAANRLGTTPQGHRVPFEYLHVLVDGHQQLPETSEDNNGTLLLRTDILPVDPAAFSTDRTAAAPDSLLTIAGEGFGPEPGQVVVSIHGQQFQAEIHGWYDLGIRFAVPNFQLTQPVEAEVLVVRGDGAVANPLTVQVAPHSLFEEAVDMPESPIPAPAPID